MLLLSPFPFSDVLHGVHDATATYSTYSPNALFCYSWLEELKHVHVMHVSWVRPRGSRSSGL